MSCPETRTKALPGTWTRPPADFQSRQRSEGVVRVVSDRTFRNVFDHDGRIRNPETSDASSRGSIVGGWLGVVMTLRARSQRQTSAVKLPWPVHSVKLRIAGHSSHKHYKKPLLRGFIRSQGYLGLGIDSLAVNPGDPGALTWHNGACLDRCLEYERWESQY